MHLLIKMQYGNYSTKHVGLLKLMFLRTKTNVQDLLEFLNVFVQ